MGELRATAAAEKTARRRAILSAATELLARWSLTDITMDRIATRTGIAKGTVYLYFRTKETLFLRLFEGLQDRWHLGLRELLNSTEKPVEGREAARMIAASLVRDPLLLRLYAVPLPVLEKDLDFESSAALNREREQRIGETAAVLHERIPGINIRQARHFLRRIGWVVAGLAQATASTPAAAQARDRQDLAASPIDFSTELEAILTALLQAVDAPP